MGSSWQSSCLKGVDYFAEYSEVQQRAVYNEAVRLWRTKRRFIDPFTFACGFGVGPIAVDFIARHAVAHRRKRQALKVVCDYKPKTVIQTRRFVVRLNKDPDFWFLPPLIRDGDFTPGYRFVSCFGGETGVRYFVEQFYACAPFSLKNLACEVVGPELFRKFMSTQTGVYLYVPSVGELETLIWQNQAKKQKKK